MARSVGIKCLLDVTNMARAIKFYKDVFGLQVLFKSGEWSELGFPDGVVALHSGRESVGPVNSGLSITVDDIDAVAVDCKEKGGRVIHGPFSPRPGLRLLVLADPDSNQLMASMDG